MLLISFIFQPEYKILRLVVERVNIGSHAGVLQRPDVILDFKSSFRISKACAGRPL
jgi:hypothetical protein